MEDPINISWGTELWDRYDSVVSHVNETNKELANFYGKFLKDRSKVEAEYARGLRSLVKSYSPKTPKKGQDETTQVQGFRLLLTELGYQAGQHELLAESYGKTAIKQVKEKVTNLNKEVDKQKKESKELERRLHQSYKLLDDSKLKYQKSHVELEITKKTFHRTESDGTVSRNEVEKMRSMTNKKTREMDDSKAQYAHQLIKTNETQQDYFNSQLPGVLENLQDLTVGTVDFMKDVLTFCVKSETEIAPIVSRCHQEMITILTNINSVKDTHIVVDRLKTGNVPPEDFQFEELQSGEEVTVLKKTSTVHASRQNLHGSDKKGGNNLYQRKRELEKKIEDHELEVAKGQKEMAAFHMMVQTYVSNPKFGDAKKFQGEMDTAANKVSILESELLTFKKELTDVETRLDSLRNGGGGRRDRSPTGSLSSSVFSGGIISNSSNHSSDNESLAGPTDSLPRGPDSGIYLTTGDSIGGGTSPANMGDWADDFVEYEVDVPPPPPPPPSTGDEIYDNDEPTDYHLGKVVALYNFDGEAESNIPMMEGEQFIVTEEDLDGWMKVKRIDNTYFNDIGEGYVPTSFVKYL